MSFLRPEARAALWRWREVLSALAVMALGIWIAGSRGPVLPGFGWVLVALGAVALVPAWWRGRVRPGGSGPGLVQIDEARVVFMGPQTGGVISLDDLTALSLRRDAGGHAVWVLADPQQILVIPTGALGAEALFDAFTRLPGLSAAELLRALEGTGAGTRRLWARGEDAPRLPRR